MSIMSTTGTRNGEDLKLNSDGTVASFDMDEMFDPLFTSFGKKLKLMEGHMSSSSSSEVGMNTPEVKPSKKHMFSPTSSLHKTTSFKKNLDKLGDLNSFLPKTTAGPDEAPCTTGERTRFGFGGQFQSSYFVNKETQSEPLPFVVPDLGDFNVGTKDSFPLPRGRQRKRMVKSKGSERSRARRLGLKENFHVKEQSLEDLD